MDLTYYDVLGVDDDAGQEDIKRAYRQASLKFHPDRDGSSRQFRAIKTAYDVLSNPVRRSAYDRELAEPPAAPPAAPPERHPETQWGSDSRWDDNTNPATQPPQAPSSWQPMPPTWTSPPAPSAAERQAAEAFWREQAAVQIRARKARRRRSHDRTVLVLAVVLSATAVLPGTIGRNLLRDRLLHPRGAGVYNTVLRNSTRYFLADWTGGCVCVLGAAAVFVLVRPWAGRLGTIVTAWLIGLALLVGILPYSRAEWTRQERVTASRLRNTVYPFSTHYLTCGQASRSFGFSSAEPRKPKVTYTLYSARYRGAMTDCNELELWEGWRKVKQIPLARGQRIKTKRSAVSVKGTTITSTVFTVKLASGQTAQYPLAELLR